MSPGLKSALLGDDALLAVLDAVPQPIVIVDASGRVAYVNDLAIGLFGDAIEIGRSLPWPAGASDVLTAAGARLSSARVTLACADGAELLVFSAASGPDAADGEREADLRWRELEALARVGSWSWDIEADLMTFSDELLPTYGLEPEVNPSSFRTFMQSMPPEVGRAATEALERCSRTGEGFVLASRMVRADGTIRGRYSRGSTVISDGRPVRMVGTIQDIDEPLEREQALRDSLAEAQRLAAENEALRAEVEAQLRELHASRSRIVESGDDARRRFERELRDGPQRRLTTVASILSGVRGEPENQTDAALVRHLADATEVVDYCQAEMRTLAQGLHPAILAEEGLVAAVASLVGRLPVPVALRAAPVNPLPPAVSTAAYFVVSEALTNVVKHAHALQGSVILERHADTLIVEVSDDGRGGATVSSAGGLGGLSDRVAALGGRLRLDSPSRHGTWLRVELPCP